MLNRFTASIIIIAGLLPVSAADYYVSPTGNDSHAGTIGAPFKTIAKARDAVRTQTASMSADINVYLRGGWHFQSSTLQFTQSDNGKNGHDVVYKAYPGEYPVISGGRQVTGWSLHDAGKNIWKASVPGLETRQLYVDCVRATRAHKGSGLPGAVQTANGYTTTDTDMQNWGNKSDIELVYNGEDAHFVKWWHWRLGIQSISGSSITMKVNSGWGGWCSDVINALTVNNALPNDIENAYELLDEAGEWYLDRATDVLYYKPLAGQSMGSVTVIAPVLEKLMTVSGTLASPVGGIRFEGITFSHATWLYPNTNAGYTNQQSNYLYGVNGFVGGNVMVTAANGVDFNKCMFKHLGGEGLELSGGAKNCLVEGCVFTDISGTGVRVGTVDDAMRSDTRKRDTGNIISNCYIHEIGADYTDACGIFGGFINELELSHNEIGYVPYSGVSLGWGWERDDGVNNYGGNNEVANNHIHHVMLSLNDGGMLYTLGNQAGNRFHHNWFQSVKATDNGGGVYPDQGSMNMEVDNNVFSEIGKFWLFIWKNTTQNINTHDNWTTTSTLRNRGTNCPVTNTTLISGTLTSWPAGAQSIANGAGLQSSYSGIKTMPCACSMISQDTSVVSTPVISPTGGTYSDSVEVSITCGTSGATIRYTTDGSDPDGSSDVYSAPFVLKVSATVKAKGFKTGKTASGIASAEYLLPVQSPFGGTAAVVPGKIEAEDYDLGGQDVAYSDVTTENQGGVYRTSEGVDVEAIPGGGYMLGFVKEGEWTEYTVNVTATGTYDITLRVANAGDGGKLHVSFDGVNMTGSVTVPNTGGWTTFRDVTVSGVSLSEGEQVMRVSFDTHSNAGGDGVANVDYIEISYAASIDDFGWFDVPGMRVDQARLYNLQGQPVERSGRLPEGIYLIRSGGVLRKIFISR